MCQCAIFKQHTYTEMSWEWISAKFGLEKMVATAIQLHTGPMLQIQDDYLLRNSK